MIRALVFDFDGIIIDTESTIIDAYAEVYAAHGVPFERTLFGHAVGHADFAFDPWSRFPTSLERDSLEEDRRRRQREREHRLTPLPGVVALLDAARAAELPLGIASNSSRNHVDGHLQRLGLRRHFQILACRGEAPSPKPEPDLYRLAVNGLGVRAHEAVAFEDSQAGILAARRAGLKVIAVPNASTVAHDFSGAHRIVASLDGLGLEALLGPLAPAR